MRCRMTSRPSRPEISGMKIACGEIKAWEQECRTKMVTNKWKNRHTDEFDNVSMKTLKLVEECRKRSPPFLRQGILKKQKLAS